MKPVVRIICIFCFLQLLVMGVSALDKAVLQIQGMEAYYTDGNSILADTYLLQYKNSISTLVFDNTTISNITYSLGVDNMEHIIYIQDSQYATANNTDITWVFPNSLEVNRHDRHLVEIKTDSYSPQYLPITLSRVMNQTEFSGEGYQKASFKVSFENITYAYENRLCDSIWTGFGANENKNLNATILLDTFSTDAQGTFSNNIYSPSFNWNRSTITLNRVYNFSVVIRVVPNGTTPVIFSPYFGVVLFNGTYRDSGTSGTSTTMPGDMLPPHLTYATASQNVSLPWDHYLLYGKGAHFNEIKNKVSSAPVANFSGTPTTGTAPLTVTFKDSSSGSPTGWAWFFGDETYTAPWTLVNASSGWTARQAHTSVAMPDGSIVLMGGYDGGYKNDTWRSMNNGVTWTQQTARAGWTARDSHTSVVMPDGSIVLMGGYDASGNYKNDTWRSMNNGTTWTLVNASSGWSARASHSSVAMPDGSIVLITGEGSDGVKNDTWRSKDNGATWIQMNASAGDSARFVHTSVAMPDGSIVLMGGYDSGGFPNEDTWRSIDNGATWTLVNMSAGCMARGSHSSVAMPDGSIVLMGGRVRELMNDTWRFQPAGASAQNPSHTYTAPGIYQVALQVFNAGGYNSMRKTGYITVTSPVVPTDKIGVFRNSTHLFYLDYNGNGAWNGASVDKSYNFGITGDIPVTGDWNNDGTDEIGVFRNSTHLFYLDYNSNGVWNGASVDRQYNFGITGDIPVSGDWNNNGISEIGVFRLSTHMFYLDYNGNGVWNGAVTDRQYNFGISGDIPISGDWNVDGRTEIGVFRPSTHLFYLDYNGNGVWNGGVTDRSYNFGISGDIPVSGHWKVDGRTEIGVFRPSTHMFYLDYNGNGVWNGVSIDRQYNFGITGDKPVSGAWA
jgi:PKD repeat protein